MKKNTIKLSKEQLDSIISRACFKNTEPRDIKRIARIMEKLTRLWTASPDLRLGQLLVNDKIGQSFYEEDNLTEAKLDKLIKKL